MKILYGIQGTGHGHISRAREIIPELVKYAEVDVLLSGYNCKMELEGIGVMRKRGISLNYNSEGSVSILKTAAGLQPITFIRDIRQLETADYNFVISDYEPVSAWAARKNGTFSVAMSHQASFLSKQSPRPRNRSMFGEAVLRHFAPCSRQLGFHFQRYDSFILPPVIRRDVRELSPENDNHVTVYLPAYDHSFLLKMFLQVPETDWHLFSPDCDAPFSVENVFVYPVGNRSFLESMKSSRGVLTGAGFETCAEAMFLGKKLLSIPISGQYEQYCNEAALKKMGVHTARKIDHKFAELLRDWINNSSVVQLKEIADTGEIVQTLLRICQINSTQSVSLSSDSQPTRTDQILSEVI